jgi:hypothetical protein
MVGTFVVVFQCLVAMNRLQKDDAVCVEDVAGL